MILLQTLNKRLPHKLKFGIYLSIFFLIGISNVYSEIVKPSIKIKPIQVVEIQLNSLMKNDEPYKDIGIIQTWEFAHPNNKKFTGPLERFKTLLSSESYKMLLNHIDHNIVEVKTTDSLASYEVTILGEGKNYYKFRWMVEKYNSDGPLKDCWLTTAVSQPVSLGSSI